MSSTQSPHGFSVVRGRGYRPAQVDERVTALTRECAELREQDGRLAVLLRELSEETERLRGVVATLPEPTFEPLGERAQLILREAEAETAEIRRLAVADVAGLRAAAREDGQARCTRAEEAAESRRARVRARAKDTVRQARTRARELVAAARREAAETEELGRARLAEVRRRGAALLRNQQRDQRGRGEAFTRELARREAETQTSVTALAERGERTWAAARRAYAEAEEAARHQREDAEARAGELLAEAAVRAERTGRETERLLRRNEERGAELHEHLVRVQGTLAELTGRLGQPVAADGR